MCRLLEERGWVLKRINGGHHVYAKAGEVTRISVPVHGGKALKLGLQRHIMRVAAIGEGDL